MIEHWKPVKRHGEHFPYEVSDLGRVRSIERIDCAGRKRRSVLLKPGLVSSGYHGVIIQKDRKRVSVLVHTLVAFAFLKNPPDDYGVGKTGINHKNGIKTDNTVFNLEWATPAQNKQHATVNGMVVRGEAVSLGKLTEHQVLEIRAKSNSGIGATSLSQSYSVSPTSIYNVLNRKSWAHI